VARVLLTAPGKGELKNIVHGINHDTLEDTDQIVSASFTTNAITPVLKASTTGSRCDPRPRGDGHSFTNDQNLIDNHREGHGHGRA
jgi:glyceraldehyde 3-phosphate dehydrogenase